MSEANTPKTSVCAPFVKLYKILLRFALGPLAPTWLLDELKFSMAPGSTCSESSNKEECHQGSAGARARRMFLWTVVLPFCIHVTIATNTSSYTVFQWPNNGQTELDPCLIHPKSKRILELYESFKIGDIKLCLGKRWILQGSRASKRRACHWHCYLL